MDSEEPPNVRVACSGDIDEVVRLMHDAAAWMSAKGTPAWDVARIDRTFAGLHGPLQQSREDEAGEEVAR